MGRFCLDSAPRDGRVAALAAAAVAAAVLTIVGCQSAPKPKPTTLTKSPRRTFTALVRVYKGPPLASHSLKVACDDGVHTVQTDAKGRFTLEGVRACELVLPWLGKERRIKLKSATFYGTGGVVTLPPVRRVVLSHHRGDRALGRFVLDERLPNSRGLVSVARRIKLPGKGLRGIKVHSKIVASRAPAMLRGAKPPRWTKVTLSWRWKSAPSGPAAKLARKAFTLALSYQADKAKAELARASKASKGAAQMRPLLAHAALAIAEARLRALLTATRASLSKRMGISAVTRLSQRVASLASAASESLMAVYRYRRQNRAKLHAAARAVAIAGEWAWWTGAAFNRIKTPAWVKRLGPSALRLYTERLDRLLGREVPRRLMSWRATVGRALALARRLKHLNLAVLADARVKLPVKMVDEYYRVESVERISWLPLALREAPGADDIKAAVVRVADAAGHSFSRSSKSSALQQAQHVVPFGKLLGKRTLLAIGRCSERKRLVKALRDARLERPRAMGLVSHVVFAEPCPVSGPPPPGGSRLFGGPGLLWSLGLTRKALETSRLVALDENGARVHTAALVGGMKRTLAALSRGWAVLAAALPSGSTRTREARAAALLTRALKARKSGDLSQARQLVERALRSAPGSAEARRLRARVATELGDISTASADVAWWRQSFGDLSADELEDELKKLRRKRRRRR